MRWIRWASALLGVCGLVSAAAGFEPAYGPATTRPSCECYRTLGAPACASPFVGWAPGCCECPPSACDNAWAGYCDQKAKWKAFWYRVGSGVHLHRPVPVAYQPKPVCYQPAMPAVPAGPVEADQSLQPNKPLPLPPLPEPVPEKTTWQPMRAWPR